MIKLVIHRSLKSKCALSGKEADGFLFSFDDGSFTQTFLSHKSFRQLIVMRLSQGAKPSRIAPEPAATETATGVRLTVHSVGKQKCALTGKEADGVLFSFDDGSFTQTFLSFKAFKQLVTMRLVQGDPRVKQTPVAQVSVNAAQAAPK